MLCEKFPKERFADKIFMNSPDGIFIIDEKGGFIDVNPSVCVITGYTYEELTNMGLLDIVHPDFAADAVKSLESLRYMGRISDEFKYVRKDGSIYYMQLDAVKSDSNTYFGFCKDISSRKLSESAYIEIAFRKRLEEQLVRQKIELEAKNRQLEAIMEGISDGLFMIDRSYDFTFLNKGGRDFFYRPETKRSAACFSDTKYYDMQGRLLAIEDMIGSRVLKGEKVKNSRIKAVRPDKTVYFSMSGNPIYDENGGVSAALICCKDITEEVEKEDLIYQQNAQLEIIIENMADGFCQIDKSKNCIKVNKAYRRVMESRTIDEIEQVSPDELKMYDENGEELPEEDIPANKLLRGEKVYQQRIMTVINSNKYYFDITGTPFMDNNGTFLYGILTNSDVTGRVQRENTIRQQHEKLLKIEQEKNEALIKTMEMKDEFLSIISHEFKTPIAVINSAIETMELVCRDELSARVKRYIGVIKQNSMRQLRLVNNLLDISRANAGQIRIHRSCVDIVLLTAAIVDSVNIYAQQKGLDIKYITTMKTKYIYLDEEKYERIILNLISNAIKFTSRDNTITVKLFKKSMRGRSKIFLEVTDTGVGIPKDKQSLIFERFGQVDCSLTRQAEGTGIGLSLVKKFVEVHQGEIKVESEVGKGSTFTVILPILEKCDNTEEKKAPGLMDDRLLQSVAIEFSDIYF